MNTNTRQDVIDYLGGSEATDEQLDRLVQAFDMLTERYPDTDDRGDLEMALSAAVQVIMGDTEPDIFGEDRYVTLRASLDAVARSTGAAVAAVLTGASEGRAASVVGLDRMTVRKALGK